MRAGEEQDYTREEQDLQEKRIHEQDLHDLHDFQDFEEKRMSRIYTVTPVKTIRFS